MNQSNGVESPARQLVIKSFLVDVFAPFDLQRFGFLAAAALKRGIAEPKGWLP